MFALLLTGILMGIELEKNAYEAKKSEKPVWENDEPEIGLRTANKGVEIPKELICPVCKDLLQVSSKAYFTNIFETKY